MGKFNKAIVDLTENKTTIVIGKITINKVGSFLRKQMRVSYTTRPKSGGVEFVIYGK